MIEQITIKRASIKDIDEISCLLEAYRAFYKRKAFPIDTLTAFISQRIKNNEVTIFLAHLDDKPIGIAQLYPAYSTLSLGKVWTLYDLYVDQACRRQGVGGKLLASCKDFAVSDGAFRLELKTERDNLQARALYERFGFTKLDTYDYYQLMLD